MNIYINIYAYLYLYIQIYVYTSMNIYIWYGLRLCFVLERAGRDIGYGKGDVAREKERKRDELMNSKMKQPSLVKKF